MFWVLLGCDRPTPLLPTPRQFGNGMVRGWIWNGDPFGTRYSGLTFTVTKVNPAGVWRRGGAHQIALTMLAEWSSSGTQDIQNSWQLCLGAAAFRELHAWVGTEGMFTKMTSSRSGQPVGGAPLSVSGCRLKCTHIGKWVPGPGPTASGITWLRRGWIRQQNVLTTGGNSLLLGSHLTGKKKNSLLLNLWFHPVSFSPGQSHFCHIYYRCSLFLPQQL